MSRAASTLLLVFCLLTAPIYAVATEGIPVCSYSLPGVRCAKWTQDFDAFGLNDIAADIASSPSGDVIYATGSTNSSVSVARMFLVAIDALTGSIRWYRTQMSPGTLSNSGTALTVSPDGTRIYVTGSGPGPNYDSDYQTLAYDSAGTLLWKSNYNNVTSGFNSDSATSLALSPEGQTVFVTGSSYNKGTRYDIATVAYNAATGSQLWVARHTGPFDIYDWGNSIVVDPDGASVYVTGSEGDINQSSIVTVSYDTATGTNRWIARSLSFAGIAIGYDLAVDPSGQRVVVSGVAAKTDSDDDFVVAAYSADDGSAIWEDRYTGIGSDLDDAALAVAISPDGSSAYATGYSTAVDWDLVTIAYNIETGARNWVSQQPGPGTDLGWDIDISPSGAVYITGVMSYPARPFIMAFSSDGSVAWRNLPTNLGLPAAVVATADGAYVAATSGTSITGYDAAVAAYKP